MFWKPCAGAGEGSLGISSQSMREAYGVNQMMKRAHTDLEGGFGWV